MKIAFLFQIPSFWASWEVLYEQCVKSKDCIIKMYLLRSQSNEVQMNRAEDFLIDNNIDYEHYDFNKVILFNPDYVIFQTPYDNGHRKPDAWSIRFRMSGIKVVYIPYGIEISDTKESRYKHFSLAVVLNAYAVYTCSQSIRQEYIKYCINSDAVMALGHPRFDALVKDHSLSGDILNKSHGRKIILWKVHFPKVFIENGIEKQATPDLNEYLLFAEYISNRTDVFFVFMPHPKFVDDSIPIYLRKKAETLIDKLKKNDNVYIDMSADYYPSFTNADAIMVDRSALMVEAGVENVPVMYLYNSNYEEPLTEPVQKLIDSYEKGTNSEDMIRFCDNVILGTDENRSKRNLALDEIQLFHDGKCSQRIIEDLLAKVNHPVNYKHRDFVHKRFIVWGAGELGRLVIENYKRKDLYTISSFVDGSGKESYIDEYSIKLPEEAFSDEFDYVVIATDKYFNEIYYKLVNFYNVSVEKIVNYDEFIMINQLEYSQK